MEVQTLADMRNLKSSDFRIRRCLKTNIKKYNIFERGAEFCLAEMKSAVRRSGGKILLGDDIGGRRSCCGRSGSVVPKCRFRLVPPV
jgi:hypothetical protein